MKGKETIITFLVIAAILGYWICSFLLIKEAFDVKDKVNPVLNSALMNISSALTGLVGGIVAAAFGVKPDSGNGPQRASKKQIKFRRVGEFITFSNDSKNPDKKEKLGNLYSWIYIIVGLSCLVVWIMLDTNATQSITNTGTTFIGMVLAIIGAYFKD